MYRTTGHTLVELIAVLTIIVIVTGLAAPSSKKMLERSKAATGINWIVRAINITRISAVDYGALTTLCPTLDDRTCGGQWNNRIMVFTDHDDNRTINGKDHLITIMYFPHQGSTLKWRAFRNKQYLQMTSYGFTNYQNGNFVYCSSDQDLQFARQVVLNRQGRVEKSYDRNDDGLIEDIYGKHLRC